MKIQFLSDINSEAIENLCVKKLEKLEKFYKGEEPTVLVDFKIDNREHLVTLKTKYNSFELISKGKSADMYKSIDLAVDNLKAQIGKNKFDKKSKRGERGLEF